MFSTAVFVENLVESVRFGSTNNVCGFFLKKFFQPESMWNLYQNMYANCLKFHWFFVCYLWSKNWR